MASSSSKEVLKAYYHQFQIDFLEFLKCRSEELVSGGRMVLTILGRESDDPSSKECCYIWELLAMALNQMVSEKDGSFTIDRLEVSRVDWNACKTELCPSSTDQEFKEDGYDVAKCMRAVAESLLVSHFGVEIIDEVFERYKKIVADRMAKERTEFFNVIVSMTRN
ncbi:Salicylate carboxymethyltransferase [Camellia lanceoleosa]|uniref:Salicylate carboxymethyltransferase n=1 Tax=Camellia lanceoleosa TaxID=1840588 RepID=A0ACC0I683_9ERIC|nr:Salicylate carboxymethyltransferase [Camellia lanceoleosa]